ncbi:hypothetical protein ACP70R_033177 [Stipagrostis hirtigluma subsp. patula]
MAQAANTQFSMDDLPLPLLEDIVRRITSTSDLNSLSVASKQLYAIDAEQRQAIRVGRGLSPATSAIASLCSRFTNLCRVEINYFGWKPDHGAQLDNHGLNVLLSSCPSLSDLALAYCSNIDDFSLAYYISCCKEAIVPQAAPLIGNQLKWAPLCGCWLQEFICPAPRRLQERLRHKMAGVPWQVWITGGTCGGALRSNQSV